MCVLYTDSSCSMHFPFSWAIFIPFCLEWVCRMHWLSPWEKWRILAAIYCAWTWVSTPTVKCFDYHSTSNFHLCLPYSFKLPLVQLDKAALHHLQRKSVAAICAHSGYECTWIGCAFMYVCMWLQPPATKAEVTSRKICQLIGNGVIMEGTCIKLETQYAS